MVRGQQRGSGFGAEPGDVVAGRYRIVEAMGSGGMATVHRAEDLETGGEVAIKLLRPEISGNPEAAERLRREAEVLARLRHPTIVGLEGFGALDGGGFFLAMELLQGETLGDVMRRGRLDVSDLVPVVAGAAAGLSAAHERGVIHRDLKPDNIYLASVQVHGRLEVQMKLLDFGISKVTGFDKITRTGQVVGTPRYMAPEQLRADQPLDGRVDVYALGVILYEALAGQAPFDSPDPTELILSILGREPVPLRSLRPDLSENAAAVVSRAMARSPEARYESATELARAFCDLPDAAASTERGRTGMRTGPMGGMDPAPSEGSSGDRSSGAAPFKPGTFSEFEAGTREPPTTAKAAPVRASREEPASSSVPLSPSSSAVEIHPSRLPWLILLILGLVGLVGATSIALIFHFGLPGTAFGGGSPAAHGPALSPSGPEGTSPEITGSPVLAEGPGRREGSGGSPELGTEADSGAASLPSGVPPPERLPELEAEPEPEPERSESHRARRRQRAGVEGVGARRARPRSGAGSRPPPSPTPPDDEGRAPPPPFEWETSSAAPAETPASLLEAARQELARGHARACTDIVTRAIQSGAGAGAYLLRGDCQSRAGQSSHAAKSYERFCRMAPGHPAVERVRPVVEAHGGYCP